MLEKNFKCDRCARKEVVKGKFPNGPENWLFCDIHTNMVNEYGYSTKVDTTQLHLCDRCHGKDDPSKDFKPDIEQAIEDLVFRIMAN